MCNRFIANFTEKVVEEIEKKEERHYILFDVDCERWGKNYDEVANIVCKFSCKREDLAKNLFPYFVRKNFSDDFEYLSVLYNILKCNTKDISKLVSKLESYVIEEEPFTFEEFSRIEKDFMENGLKLFESLDLMNIFDSFEFSCRRIFLLEDPTKAIDKMIRNGLRVFIQK